MWRSRDVGRIVQTEYLIKTGSSLTGGSSRKAVASASLSVLPSVGAPRTRCCRLAVSLSAGAAIYRLDGILFYFPKRVVSFSFFLKRRNAIFILACLFSFGFYLCFLFSIFLAFSSPFMNVFIFTCYSYFPVLCVFCLSNVIS